MSTVVPGLIRGLIGACALTLSVSAFAAESGHAAEAAHAPAGPAFLKGDAKAGETKAGACAACHGPAGNSAMPAWPKLAGQGAPYTYAQLKAFKEGKRANPIMQAQAAPLSDQDMQDLAAYFAAQPAAPGVASKDAVAVAEKLYRAGNAESGVPACAACHGPTGAGNPAAGYPRVGGQHADYNTAQLTAYRKGERKAGANGQIMSEVAAKLTDEEIAALASYLNGLR
ncbi:MAG: cytochrome c4 [Panacagrimonas sp.]|jgi:cytochrome c553|nr:c-type cytochrome [Panacagrimonas sp.]MCC2656556.1 cytochrome c4 [Panacagrimonas sp.]